MLMSAPFNVIGDSVAGFAGALAFIWLIVTVMLQGRELAAQREEWRLAREVQEQQLVAMQAQADIFAQEKSDREMRRADVDMDERLVDLYLTFDNNGIKQLSWGYKKSTGQGGWSKGTQQLVYWKPFNEYSDKHLHEVLQGVLDRWDRLLEFQADDHIHEFPAPSDMPFIQDLIDRIDQIFDKTSTISEAMQLRLKRLPLRECHTALTEIKSNEFLWQRGKTP